MGILLFLPTTGGTQSYSYTMVGGGVAGGTLAYLRSSNYTMTSGGVIGGIASYLRSSNFSSIGGGIAGGITEIVGTLGRSGGGVTAPNLILSDDGHLLKKVSGIFYKKL